MELYSQYRFENMATHMGFENEQLPEHIWVARGKAVNASAVVRIM